MKRNSLTTRELRKFGLVMAAPLTLIGGVLLWRGRTTGMILLGLAGLFLLLAGVAPRALAPVERYWMAFAEKLGAVMTRVILTLTFYLVITPIGLLLRLMGGTLQTPLPLPRARCAAIARAVPHSNNIVSLTFIGLTT